MSNRFHRAFVLIFFSFFAILCFFAFGQEKPKLTVEWLYSEEGKNVARLPSFFWLNDGTAFIYDPIAPIEKRTILKFDPKTGVQNPALDAKKALASLNILLGKEATPKSLEWPLTFSASGKLALYMFKDDIYLLNLPSSQFLRVTNTKAEEKCVNFSPDEKKLAFVRDNNLFVYDIEAGAEKQLTKSGSETILNGTLSWVYWEEILDRQDIGYWWSEDSKAIAFLQSDESPVSIMYYVDFKPDVPRLIKQRYPIAGGANPVVRVGIVEVESSKLTKVDFSENPYEYICRVKWLPDSRRLSVQTMNRAQTELDLFFVDREGGKPIHILKEKDRGWVNIHDDLYFLKDGKHFIWASERDGFEHLYQYAIGGKLVNKITKGEWAIRSSGGGPFWLRQAVASIDEKNGWIYFTSLEKSSVERHLYRIRFDGDGIERLTKEDGFHAITFSPDAEYYIDRYSNISTLPSLALYKSDGQHVSVIAEPRPGGLAKYDIDYPELFSIPARDKFPMPAELLKMKDFNPAKKYPVIIYVYGGPSAPTVANAWRKSILFDQILLDQGYLVLQVDNRSATAISKKLENIILRFGDIITPES